MKSLIETTEELSNELNKMHSSNHPKGLIELVKRQAEEIDRRGQVIMKMEDSLKLQKENIEKLLLQNKHLEVMIETMRAEREKLLEDAEMERPAWVAEALQRLRTYEQAAYKSRQNQVAINAVQAQAKLIGLDT